MGYPTISKLELKRLHDMGFALHWLREKSKVPIQKGWTQGDRLEFQELMSLYETGMNIGVRLGSASKIGSKFLAVIDVDVKGDDFCDGEEAWEACFKAYPEAELAPRVLSGRGNGSAHFYVLLNEPLKGDFKIQSDRRVKVFMPSVMPSGRDRVDLKDEEIKQGFRMRAAWEVSLMSEGRQVVLPPSIHPDTGKPYIWEAGFESAKDFPLVNANPPTEKVTGAGTPTTQPAPAHFPKINLKSLNLKPAQVKLLTKGEGSSDRSAECLGIALALVNRKVERSVIVNVLTDRDNFLAHTAYDHTKSDDRKVAAAWMDKYIVSKAFKTYEDEKEAESKIFETVIAQETAFDKGEKTAPAEAEKDWESFLERTKHGDLKPTFRNVLLIIENVIGSDCLRRNSFDQNDYWQYDTSFGIQAETKRKGVLEDELAFKEWFAFKFGMDVSTNLLYEVFDRIAEKNKFHPVKEFLEELTWDGVSRIDLALNKYLGVKDDIYTRAVSRKFFLALIKRIYEPGCKFDSIPVLEGAQGIGKSSFGRILVGTDWYMDGLPDLNDKDAALNLQGIWLCEMSELSSIYRSHIEAAKAFITRQTDKVRPPYGRRRIDIPRSSVFIGTTNDDTYLKDKTGNRRYWPVIAQACDFDALESDRLQLLAEAKFIYDFETENLWLEGKAKAIAELEQAARVVEDEQDVIESKISKWVETKKQKIAFSIHELFTETDSPLLGERRDGRSMTYASKALKRLGFTQRRTKKERLWDWPTFDF